MISKVLSKRLKTFETSDFQNRGGSYPRSNIPTDIVVYSDELVFSFKNTSEEDAKDFVERFIERNKSVLNIPKKLKQTITVYQDGDYQDDWVVCNFTLR